VTTDPSAARARGPASGSGAERGEVALDILRRIAPELGAIAKTHRHHVVRSHRVERDPPPGGVDDLAGDEGDAAIG